MRTPNDGARVERDFMNGWSEENLRGFEFKQVMAARGWNGIGHWLTCAIHRGGWVRVTPFWPWAVDFRWEDDR